MKKIALAAALSVAASSAFAGGIEAPVTPEVEVTKSASSSGGVLIPLLLLVLVAAAVASN